MKKFEKLVILTILAIGILAIVIDKWLTYKESTTPPKANITNAAPVATVPNIPTTPNVSNTPIALNTSTIPNIPTTTTTPNTPTTPATTTQQPLPKLMDFGSITCIPCKAMKPILDELRTEYAGKMEVIFIDVEEQPEMAELYGIQLRPTQVFMDANNKELGRNEGFLSKADILAKCYELGMLKK